MCKRTADKIKSNGIVSRDDYRLVLACDRASLHYPNPPQLGRLQKSMTVFALYPFKVSLAFIHHFTLAVFRFSTRAKRRNE